MYQLHIAYFLLPCLASREADRLPTISAPQSLYATDAAEWDPS